MKTIPICILFKKYLRRVFCSKRKEWAAILQGGDLGEDKLKGEGMSAASLLTLPEGEVRSVQRSRTLSASPLLAPMAQQTWFLPLGSRTGGVPGAKTPSPLPLAPIRCLTHHSTSHSHPADTVARLGPWWPRLRHKVYISR